MCFPGQPLHADGTTVTPATESEPATTTPLSWQGLYNGWRLSGIRAHHVLAPSRWPGANGHSKRVLAGACR